MLSTFFNPVVYGNLVLTGLANWLLDQLFQPLYSYIPLAPSIHIGFYQGLFPDIYHGISIVFAFLGRGGLTWELGHWCALAEFV